jgi:hypothetical protein
MLIISSQWPKLAQDDETFVKPSEESLAGHSSDTSRINDYSWAIQVLQLFTNTLVKTIESWQEFSRIHLPTFLPGEGQADYSSQVPSYLQRLDRDISELRYFHTLLGQRIVTFESRRTMVSSHTPCRVYFPLLESKILIENNEILNTSALMETRISNTQAADVRSLTKVTMVS